jgi:hypothetical protein
VIAKNYIDVKYGISDAYSVGDGTYLLFSSLQAYEYKYVILLDQALNTVKEVRFKKDDANQIGWFYDDGFFCVDELKNRLL